MMKKILLILFALLTAGLFISCTQYERDGMNPKPFNAPAGWELSPDANMIRN